VVKLLKKSGESLCSPSRISSTTKQPPEIQLGSSGERCKLSSGVQGEAPTTNAFCYNLGAKNAPGDNSVSP